ncbi:MAG: NAD(P)H-hydrate dehydratase [Gemmataceae bacterium]|nr:NAD(P)H-hydrate dehydratase [Gemmataceae bacterium]
MSDPFDIITELPRLAPRRPDSNKGSFGRVLVIAGSRGMAGAGVLCASAALRAGAGLVKLAVPEELAPRVAVANPCVMTAALPCDEAGRFRADAAAEALHLAQAHDVVAIGPGLGRGPGLAYFVGHLLARYDKPIVLDADGLNNLADDPKALQSHAGPVTITPHPGEFARLLHVDTAAVQANRRELAARFARDHRLVVVLKGLGTVVTDGRRLFCNPTGNPGMATAGSGDVLTGVIAALIGQSVIGQSVIGQGLAPLAAAQLGAYLHGLAGDCARAAVGEISLIATDLIDYLPQAIQQYLREPHAM